MANPLKILTVLTASEAAQFKKAVQVETGGLTVSAGDTNLQAVYATNISASGNAQVGGNVTVAGDITLRDANLRDARLSGNAYLANAYLTGAFLSGDAYLANAFLTGATVSGTASVGTAVVTAVYGATAYFSGSTLNVDGVAFNTITSSIKTLITNEATARIAGDAAVAATASANLNTVSGALKSYIDAQDSADAAAWAAADAQVAATASANLNTVSGALKSYIDAQDTALSQSVSSSHYTAKAALEQEDTTFLKLDGSRAMTGNLNASSVQVSASSLNVGGAAYVGGDLSVQGNLQVLGNIDAISRSDLYVTDAVIMVASGAANAAAANGAGLEVDGADASIKYASSGDRWLANKDMEVSAAYFAGGQKLLEKASMGAAVGARLGYSDYGYVGVANFTYGDGVLIGGKAAVGIETPNLTVVATSSFQRDATFQSQVAMDAALKLSGSAFNYIATPIVSGKYDVNDAIRALDVAVSGAVNAGSSDLNTLKSNYDALRQVVTGTLSSGTALLTLAGAQFAAGQIDNLALDVMIDADNTGYTNDLVAIKMFVDGAAVKVQIDAPAAASAKYRLIVVNEADGKL